MEQMQPDVSDAVFCPIFANETNDNYEDFVF